MRRAGGPLIGVILATWRIWRNRDLHSRANARARVTPIGSQPASRRCASRSSMRDVRHRWRVSFLAVEPAAMKGTALPPSHRRGSAGHSPARRRQRRGGLHAHRVDRRDRHPAHRRRGDFRRPALGLLPSGNRHQPGWRLQRLVGRVGVLQSRCPERRADDDLSDRLLRTHSGTDEPGADATPRSGVGCQHLRARWIRQGGLVRQRAGGQPADDKTTYKMLRQVCTYTSGSTLTLSSTSTIANDIGSSPALTITASIIRSDATGLPAQRSTGSFAPSATNPSGWNTAQGVTGVTFKITAPGSSTPTHSWACPVIDLAELRRRT